MAIPCGVPCTGEAVNPRQLEVLLEDVAVLIIERDARQPAVQRIDETVGTLVVEIGQRVSTSVFVGTLSRLIAVRSLGPAGPAAARPRFLLLCLGLGAGSGRPHSLLEPALSVAAAPGCSGKSLGRAMSSIHEKSYVQRAMSCNVFPTKAGSIPLDRRQDVTDNLLGTDGSWRSRSVGGLPQDTVIDDRSG